MIFVRAAVPEASCCGAPRSDWLEAFRKARAREDANFTFALNPDGSIDQAKLRAVSPATDCSFDFQDLLLRPVRATER